MLEFYHACTVGHIPKVDSSLAHLGLRLRLVSWWYKWQLFLLTNWTNTSIHWLQPATIREHSGCPVPSLRLNPLPIKPSWSCCSHHPGIWSPGTSVPFPWRKLHLCILLAYGGNQLNCTCPLFWQSNTTAACHSILLVCWDLPAVAPHKTKVGSTGSDYLLFLWFCHLPLYPHQSSSSWGLTMLDNN